jgi:Fic family protein
LSSKAHVVSGPVGKEHVHFDMKAFLKWFEGGEHMDLVLKTGLAHLWFVTIHPFHDGNGRIARAIADMALARSENSPQRFYSTRVVARYELVIAPNGQP